MRSKEIPFEIDSRHQIVRHMSTAWKNSLRFHKGYKHGETVSAGIAVDAGGHELGLTGNNRVKRFVHTDNGDEVGYKDRVPVKPVWYNENEIAAFNSEDW